jgi:DNA-directed RNA polymerase specialized sigma24 family protein
VKLSCGGRAEEDARRYISGKSFCNLFSDRMAEFYQLAFLLTADPTLTEECFIAALEDCISASNVSRDWAHTWARRAIVKNAVRIVKDCTLHGPSSQTDRDGGEKIPNAAGFVRPEFDAILALPIFDRFVFVLSLLERFPAGEISSLLGRPIKEVLQARISALLEAASPTGRKLDAADRSLKGALLEAFE